MGERVRGWLHPGWAWTVRYPRTVPFGYSVGSLALGVGLSALGALVPGGLTAAQDQRLRRLMWVAFGVAAVLYAAAEVARQGRNRMLKRNGTAYIVRERARDWDADDSGDFYGQVRRRFARVLEVPGPGQTGRAWDWPLDTNAREWDGKVTELVRSFRVLYLASKEPGVPNAVFVTAWWAVALAFGRRVTAADRSLDLEVWQRRGHGRAGKVDPEIWRQRGHRFGDTPVVPGSVGLEFPELSWAADLTVVRDDDDGDIADGSPVSVLLLRFGRAPWKPLPAVDAEPANPDPWPLTLRDTAGVIPVKGTASVRIHELRCTPPGAAPQFDWADFPVLAAEAVAWVQRKSAELAGHVLLLGTTIPNELALGIGIAAGQENCLAWPSHLWPIVYRKPAESYVVPHLDLGADPVPG